LLGILDNRGGLARNLWELFYEGFSFGTRAIVQDQREARTPDLAISTPYSNKVLLQASEEMGRTKEAPCQN